MNIVALAEQFHEQGYLLVEDMFAPKLMDQYHALILEHFGESPAFAHNEEFLSRAATEVIPWFPQQGFPQEGLPQQESPQQKSPQQKSPPERSPRNDIPEQKGVATFDEVQDDPRLLALTDAILGDGWRALYCMVMFSRRGTRGQAWHQDCAPEDPAVFNMNRLVYTEDITPAVGGQVVVVPGSHRRGLISVGPVDEDFEDQVVLSPRKGALVLLHGHIWHRVLPVSGGDRVSTNYRCSPLGTPDDITDICVYRNMRYRFETSEVVEERA